MSELERRTERRVALRDFLRSRRQRIEPEDVGLPKRVKRQRSGLRREELAALAGISVTWYTQLEQGREIGVSLEVIESLARVLRLDSTETEHLHILARGQLPIVESELRQTVPQSVRNILDAFRMHPAYVINRRWDILAWNNAYLKLGGDLRDVPIWEQNMLWRLFVLPEYRTLLEDWEGEARKAVAIFRATTRGYVGQAWYEAFLEHLTTHAPEFSTWWDEQHVQAKHDDRKVFCHPQLGRLVLQNHSLQIVGEPHLQLIVYIPLDEEETPLKLAALLS